MPPVETTGTATATNTEPDLMALAAAADAGQPVTTAPSTPAPAEQTTPSTPADSGAPAKPDDKPATAKPDKPATADKPESAYAKAQKDAERRDKSWKALEQEKAQVRAEAERVKSVQTELEQLRRQVHELRQPPKPAADAAGIDADTYDSLAKKYDEEGDTKMAGLARERAQALRRQAAATPAAAAPVDSWKTSEFQQQWQRHTDEIIAADPALNDAQNPVFQATNMLVNHKEWAPFFRAEPHGIKAAVEVAKLMHAAQRVPALQKEIDTHKAEIARLNKLNAPRGGGPTAAPAGEKKLTEMSPDEAEAHVRALAAAADRGA
jgi:hypothetical protein